MHIIIRCACQSSMHFLHLSSNCPGERERVVILELTHQRDESLKNLRVINGEFVIELTFDVDFDMMIINLNRRRMDERGGDLSQRLIRICYIDPSLFFFVFEVCFNGLPTDYNIIFFFLLTRK